MIEQKLVDASVVLEHAESRKVHDLRVAFVQTRGVLEAIRLAAFAVSNGGLQIEERFFVFGTRIFHIAKPLLCHGNVARDKVRVCNVDERCIALVRILVKRSLRKVFSILDGIRHVANRIENVFAIFKFRRIDHAQKFFNQSLGALHRHHVLNREEHDFATFPTHVAHSQIVNQVRNVILVVISLRDFDKERSGIVEQVVPRIHFFVICLERQEVAAKRPSQKFKLELHILDFFNIVKTIRNRLVQFVRAVQQTALSVHNFAKSLAKTVFFTTKSRLCRRRLPKFFLFSHVLNVEIT